MDSTSCPIVAGAPKVIRAAFTKEVDFFERAGVEYVDAAVTLTEPNYLVKQLYEAWGKKLRITHDECEFAVQQGFEALKRFDVEMQRKGSEVLAQLEDENRAGLLLLGRPYHNDPGLNHGVLDEFQALGYPILSIRSIPKEPEWLERFFDDDLRRGMVDSPLSVADVWPENYSANSVQKVWAAKLAARHPNLVVLDLSSFKCGHDAPTYGLIDHILSATATPAMNLHDIDANKPSGSILIRVKTYAHTLKLHEEKLKQEAANRNELQKRVAEKRRELLALQRAQLDRDADLQLMNEAYQAYLDADVTIELPDRDFTFEAMGDTQAHSGHQTALALVNGHRFVIEERTDLQPIQAGQQIALDSTLLSSLNQLDTNSKKSQQITCSSCTPHSCPTCAQ
jgi:predicted nucleotide-binding protein (sugar kinase/HSP70/actin superfamily)